MIIWKKVFHLSGSKYHSSLYTSNYKGKKLQKEVHTPVLQDYGGPKDFGKAETSYFIAGDEREFKTESELIKAIEKSQKELVKNV